MPPVAKMHRLSILDSKVYPDNRQMRDSELVKAMRGTYPYLEIALSRNFGYRHS